MRIDRARQVANEYGVEEGAEYNWYSIMNDELAGVITVTGTGSSGEGLRMVEYQVEAVNGNTAEKTAEVATIAGYLDAGFWEPRD